MLEGEIESRVRFLIAEPSTRRFTQAMIASEISRAQTQLALEIDFPEAIERFIIVDGQREYQMPEMIKIKRVYMVTLREDGSDGAQQPLFGTDVATLQGIIQETYDNTSGVVQGAPVQTPQWIVAPPTLYPVTKGVPVGGRVPTKSPYTPGQRPSWYRIGGSVGVTPPPIATTPSTVLKVVYVPVPPALVRSVDRSILPSIMMDAICYKTIEYLMLSDRSSLANDYAMRYKMEVENKLRPWIQAFSADQPKSLVPVTRRSNRRRGY